MSELNSVVTLELHAQFLIVDLSCHLKSAVNWFSPLLSQLPPSYVTPFVFVVFELTISEWLNALEKLLAHTSDIFAVPSP